MVHNIVIGLVVFLTGALSFGQTPMHGLVAGKSIRADVERVVGKPVQEYSQTLIEYHSTDTHVAKLFVQYGTNSPIVERIEVLFVQPLSRAAVFATVNRYAAAARQPDLPEQPTVRGKNGKRLVEYFGAPYYVVLTYQGADVNSGVARSARYSPELFASAVPAGADGQAVAQPTSTPLMSPASPGNSFSQPGSVGGHQQAGPTSGSAGMTAASEVLTPVGSSRAHVFGLKLLTPINSETSKAGDLIRAEVISPNAARGSEVAGVIRGVSCTTAGVLKCVLRFSLDTMTYNGDAIPVVGEVDKLTNSKGWPHVDEEGEVVSKGGNWMQAIVNPYIAASINGTPLGPHPEVFIELTANGRKLSFDAGTQFSGALQSDLAQRR